MSNQNKIIMVNSFKGGAGKTSIALCQCVSNLMDSEPRYDNIFYLDIDILGTGVAYILFEDNKRDIVYFNGRKEQRNGCENVNLIMEYNDTAFYAIVLNPASRRIHTYNGKEKLRQYPEVDRRLFKQSLIDLISEILKNGERNLIVIDSSPGLSEMEIGILDAVYQMEGEKAIVEEEYITTCNASHIRKTIDCLNECNDLLYRKNRKVSIILNDINDCRTIGGEKSIGNPFEFDVEKIVSMIKKKIGIKKCEIQYNKFNEKILTGSIIYNERKLVNDPDAYNTLPRVV